MKRTLLFLALGLILLGVEAAGQTKSDIGRELLKQGKVNEAISFLQDYLRSSSRDAQAWFVLAQAYETGAKPDSAEIAAGKAVNIDDELQDAYVLESRMQLIQKKYHDAYATVHTGIRAKKQEYAPLLIQLGRVLLLSDSADAALVAFTRAREIQPDNPVIYEGLGDSYAKQGVGPLAISQYERSLELDSLQPALWHKLATLEVKERRYTDAAKAFLHILAQQADNHGARLELASLYFRARQYANCARTLKEYFVKNRNVPRDVQSMYMEALYQSRQYKEALHVAQEFLKQDPNSVLALRIVGHSAWDQKQYDTSVDVYTKLRALDTLTVDDLSRLGRAYRQAKKDSLAAVTLEEALAKDSTETGLYNEIGAIWMGLRNWERAAAMFKKRLQIDTTAIAAYINYGACVMQMDEFEDASRAFEKAIALNPQYPPAYIRLASCLYQLKKYEEGRKVAEKVIEVIDTAKAKYRLELADANRMIGLACLLDKKWEDGIKYLRESLKYKEDEPQTHLLLAQALQNLQKNEEAFKEYKRVLQIDPKNDAAKKGYETLKPLVE